MAPTMRWGLVMFLSPSRGTLKSTCGRAHVSFRDGWVCMRHAAAEGGVDVRASGRVCP
jgi:hypothetical protein